MSAHEQTHQYTVQITVDITGPKGMASSLQKSLTGMVEQAFSKGDTIGPCRIQLVNTRDVQERDMDIGPNSGPQRYRRIKSWEEGGYDLSDVEVPEEEVCDGCDGKLFVHMDDPFEIQRCDQCSQRVGEKPFFDDDAIRVHAEKCGCGWPPQDYQNAVSRRLGYAEEDFAGQVIATEDYDAFLKLQLKARDREAFKENISDLIITVDDLVSRFRKYGAPVAHLVTSSEILREAEDLVDKGEWRPWWTQSSSEFHESWAEKKA